MNCLVPLIIKAKKGHTDFLLGTVLFLLYLPLTCQAQLDVGTGASVDTGSGSINMNCLDVNVDGTMKMSTGQLQKATNISVFQGALLQGNSGEINYSGNWSNLGSFQAGQSSVNLTDDCNTGTSLIVGDNDFNRFSAVTQSVSRELTVAAGSEQGFIGGLELVGIGPGRINLNSSADNSPAFFVVCVNATQQRSLQ